MNDREYLFNLLNHDFFVLEINRANSPLEIYEISRKRKQAEAMLKMIECSKTTIQHLHYEDDIPDAIDDDDKTIPIEVELTAEQLDIINDTYNIKYHPKKLAE